MLFYIIWWTIKRDKYIATFYYAGRYLAKRSLAESLIENVLESLEKDGLIATRTDKNGEKDIIPISDVIAKAVKDANTK